MPTHPTETPTQYVRRRHAHLQAQGMRDPEICARLAAALASRPFAPGAAPVLGEDIDRPRDLAKSLTME